jgi:hypothetical protein
MKHLIRLLLAVCCLAFVQVGPVAALAPDQGGCSCCDCGGVCEMPECAPLPAARAPILSLDGTRSIQTERRRRSGDGRRRADLKAPELKASAFLRPLPFAKPGLRFDSGPPGFVQQCRLLI